jgi:hypothetical protein
MPHMCSRVGCKKRSQATSVYIAYKTGQSVLCSMSLSGLCHWLIIHGPRTALPLKKWHMCMHIIAGVALGLEKSLLHSQHMRVGTHHPQPMKIDFFTP